MNIKNFITALINIVVGGVILSFLCLSLNTALKVHQQQRDINLLLEYMSMIKPSGAFSYSHITPNTSRLKNLSGISYFSDSTGIGTVDNLEALDSVILSLLK